MFLHKVGMLKETLFYKMFVFLYDNTIMIFQLAWKVKDNNYESLIDFLTSYNHNFAHNNQKRNQNNTDNDNKFDPPSLNRQ